jgi:hypothetical protein
MDRTLRVIWAGHVDHYVGWIPVISSFVGSGMVETMRVDETA